MQRCDFAIGAIELAPAIIQIGLAVVAEFLFPDVTELRSKVGLHYIHHRL